MFRNPKTVVVLTLAGLLAVSTVWAAGGSSVPQTDPADQAADAYNRGIKARDKAWKIEAEAAGAGDSERAKLEKKVRKEYEKAIRAFRAAIESNPPTPPFHAK